VFGVGLARVLEVLELPRLIPLPGVPPHLLGLATWRNRSIPVIDLAHRLGLPPAAVGPRSRLLVLRTTAGAEPLGTVARPTMRLVRLPLPHRPSDRRLPLEPSLTRAVVELQHETLVIPNLAALRHTERT
jgi:chemotaxis signal transduction protein